MMRNYLLQNIHPSWIIASASMAIFIGIISAPHLSFQVISIGWLLSGVACILFAVTDHRAAFITFAILGGIIVGLWRGQNEQVNLAAYNRLYGSTVELSGVIFEDSDLDKHGNTTLRLTKVSYQGTELPGKVWVSLATKASVQRSDTVTIHGKIEEGFGTFAASLYRADVVSAQRPEPGDIALHVRDWFAGAVRQVIEEPEASLGVGYLVGQRRALPEKLDTALQVAGLTHVVVASGYNLTILIRLARRLFARISKYLAALSSAGLILSFIAVTGLSPSMSRAGLVAGLSLLAWYYGRTIHPFVLLPIAIAVTVLVNPNYAWGDVGWQLSFTAFAGVMILAPLLQRYYFGDKQPGVIRQIIGETFSAWLLTLPILMYTFGYISNVAIFANLLVLPFVPLAMLLTFIAGISAIIIPTFAAVIAFPGEVLLRYMVEVTYLMANVSWAQTEITISGLHVIGMYILICSFTGYLWYKTRLDLGNTSIIE